MKIASHVGSHSIGDILMLQQPQECSVRVCVCVCVCVCVNFCFYWVIGNGMRNVTLDYVPQGMSTLIFLEWFLCCGGF